MEKQHIRWGIISTARINRRVIPAIKMSPRGQLVAVASRRQDTAQAYAQEWDIPQAFAGYESMLASDEIDAVYISVPNHMHVPTTLMALEAGKHVLCEKPFGLTIQEVDQVREKQAETALVVAEAFMYRHHPQTKLVGEMVRSGRLGEILSLRGTFNFKVSDLANVRLVPQWGGGSLWDVGVYPLSFAQYLMGGPPETVTGWQWEGPTGVDEHFVAHMTYENGRVAQFTSSFSTPFHTEFEIMGTAGRLHMTRPFTGVDEPAQAVILYDQDNQTEEIAVPDEYLYLGEVEDMHRAILDGDPPYLTLSETRNHIATVQALYRSAADGRSVQLTEITGG